MICADCKQDHEGLTFVVPNKVWKAICGSLNVVLCPWCTNKRLEKFGIDTQAEVNLSLPHLRGTNSSALEHFEQIDRLKWSQQH